MRRLLTITLVGVCGLIGGSRLTGAIERVVDQPQIATAQDTSNQHSHIDMTLPIVVDGSVTPEKISDNLAYYHFILAASPATDTEKADDTESRHALLQQVGLNMLDEAAFGSYLKGVKAELVQIAEAKRQANESGRPEDVTFFRERERELVAAARAGLQQTLSPDGATALDTYVINEVKRHIVIYGADIQ